MDSLKTIYQQFDDLYKSMLPSQRATLGTVLVLVVGSMGFLIYQGTSSSYVAASWGKVFTTEEIINVEQSLIQQGMTDFRREGQRIMVPKGEADRYNAALLEAGSLPDDWAEEWERQFEKSSAWAGKDELMAKKEIALAKQLRRVIRAIPDIEDGNAVWAYSKSRRRFGSSGPQVTAMVYVKPKRGRELSGQLVSSLRAAVAAMVPDLKAVDVTVLDQSTGMSHSGDDENSPFGNSLLTRIQRFEHNYQTKISNALSYIDGVNVSVNVDLDNLKSSVERIQKTDPKNKVTLSQTQQTRTETTNQKPGRSEPGQNANQPKSLNSSPGQEKTGNIEMTNSSTVNAASFTISEKVYQTAVPQAVKVAISIPEDYFRKVLLKYEAAAGQAAEGDGNQNAAAATITKTDIEKNIEDQVAKLIPEGSTAESVHVGWHEPVDPEPVTFETSMTDQATDMFGRWGGTIGLTLFALWALRMLNKSMPKLPEVESGPTNAGLPESYSPEPTADEAEAIIQPVEFNERDQLQLIVKDNPELAAAVLSKWIQEAK